LSRAAADGLKLRQGREGRVCFTGQPVIRDAASTPERVGREPGGRRDPASGACQAPPAARVLLHQAPDIKGAPSPPAAGTSPLDDERLEPHATGEGASSLLPCT